MTEREQKILRLLQWYRSDFGRSAVDERNPPKYREIFSAFGRYMDEVIQKVKQIIEEKE
jgi:hypothetical protein